LPIANPFHSYRQAAVTTADRGELLIMTYEAILRWLARSRLAIESGNVVDSHEGLINAQKLVANLSISLDFEKGGEIAQNLRTLYDYVTDRLMWANINKDTATIDAVVGLLRPLLEAWRSAVAQTRKDPGMLAAVSQPIA